MKWIAVICIGTMLLNCSSTDSEDDNSYPGYDFSSPAFKLTLPSILNEISGQVVIDDSTIACIQDENGIIFIYDTKKNEIRQRIEFAGDGDYEEICKMNKDLVILRSDGLLYFVSNYATTPMTDTFASGIPADNNEGLCYDSINNRLLIACKGKIAKGPENKDRRAIYGFDLSTKSLTDEPVFEFDVTELIGFAEKHNIDLPTKEKKKGVSYNLKFRTSAIDIHPVTGELYVLSAVDHALFIFDKAGNTLEIEMLDEQKFNKAEGISFYPNGDVLITNEAQDKKPTLMKFSYEPLTN